MTTTKAHVFLGKVYDALCKGNHLRYYNYVADIEIDFPSCGQLIYSLPADGEHYIAEDLQTVTSLGNLTPPYFYTRTSEEMDDILARRAQWKTGPALVTEVPDELVQKLVLYDVLQNRDAQKKFLERNSRAGEVLSTGDISGIFIMRYNLAKYHASTQEFRDAVQEIHQRYVAPPLNERHEQDMREWRERMAKRQE